MDDCIFCRIVKGEIPCYMIYENEDVMCFLDVRQDFYGHTIVVPKKHYKNTLDCDEDVLHKVISAVQKVSKHYVENCGIKGAVIINNNNKEGDQSVFHLHYHIIPRMSADEEKDPIPGSIKIDLADQQRHLSL